MPRDIGTGLYHYPAGTEGNTAQTIFSARYNTFINDLANTLNQELPVNMGGTGADNAAEARDNLDAEVAGAHVTNYDTHVFESGSFYSNAGATAAPNGDPFVGICQVHDNENYIVVEATDILAAVGTRVKHQRIKQNGVWGAWFIAGDDRFLTNAEGDALYVNTAGDTMTGNLYINTANAKLELNKTGAGQSNHIAGLLNSSLRWMLRLGNDVVETGGEVGNNLDILRFNDAGVYTGSVMEIRRNTGEVIVQGPPLNTNGVATKGYVDQIASTKMFNPTIGAQDTLDYTVGTTVFAFSASEPGRNAAAFLRLIYGSRFTPDTAGPVLSGTWVYRGACQVSTGFILMLAQRVS